MTPLEAIAMAVGKIKMWSIEKFATKEYVDAASNIVVDDSFNSMSDNPVQNKVVYAAILSKSDIDHTHTALEVGALSVDTDIPDSLADLADDATHRTVTDEEKMVWNAKSDFSGDYKDLINQPIIPQVPVQSVNGKVGAVVVTSDDVGADPIGSAVNTVSHHNTDTATHADIRMLISELTTKVTHFLNVDDTSRDQLSELLDLIDGHADDLKDITTGKVNKSDIVDNLNTNVADKPLSSAQGVVLKALFDGIVIPTKVSDLYNDNGYITGYTETDPTVPDWAKADNKPSYTAGEVGADVEGAAANALTNANAYTDSKIYEHTHNYAGSSSAGGAAISAEKINTDAGSATQPVYFINGIPVQTTYELNKSVPADAEFTDTTYSVATQNADGLMSSADKTKLDDILSTIYPVGSIYLSVDETSPASLFGGEWTSIGGKFLLGADTTYTAGSTGGEVNHTLTVNELPEHNHEQSVVGVRSGDSPKTYVSWNANNLYGNTASSYTHTFNTGGNKAHNNMPPYLAVYMWERTK